MARPDGESRVIVADATLLASLVLPVLPQPCG